MWLSFYPHTWQALAAQLARGSPIRRGARGRQRRARAGRRPGAEAGARPLRAAAADGGRVGVIARLGTVAAASWWYSRWRRPRRPRTVGAADYLRSRQQSSGGFAEPGRQADPSADRLGRARSTRGRARSVPEAVAYLAGKPFPTATDLELRILALAALGRERERARPPARGAEALERRDRADAELDDLGRTGAAGRRPSGRQGHDPLPEAGTAPQRRLPLGRRAEHPTRTTRRPRSRRCARRG